MREGSTGCASNTWTFWEARISPTACRFRSSKAQGNRWHGAATAGVIPLAGLLAWPTRAPSICPLALRLFWPVGTLSAGGTSANRSKSFIPALLSRLRLRWQSGASGRRRWIGPLHARQMFLLVAILTMPMTSTSGNLSTKIGAGSAAGPSTKSCLRQGLQPSGFSLVRS